MIPQELHRVKALLDSFLGPSKKELDDTYQCQYGCPLCISHKGERERNKFNLEVNIRKNIYNAWCCSQYDESMKGTIPKLIRLFGNEEILKEYKNLIYTFKQNKLYELSFSKDDFNLDYNAAETKDVELPANFVKFNQNGFNPKKPLQYLMDRGIGWDIINKYKIGYTQYDDKLKQVSSRIIIPSYNKFGELNYWTGRDFTDIKGRQKYFNPVAERRDLIFNEEHIQWDADITLVEGPFDHIVVPNSIPLLGKVLKTNFKIYEQIAQYANANINLFLDADAYDDVKAIYRLLNHNNLYGRIRYIPVEEGMDPSKIYELYGNKGIIDHLRNSQTIEDIYLG